MQNANLMTSVKLILLLLLFSIGYSYCFKKMEVHAKEHTEDVLYVPSPKMLKLFSLDYSSLISKMLLFRMMIYYGGRYGKPANLEWLYHMADTSTYLDPYNIDTYYFTSAILPWNNMAKETNIILERGLKKRNWDYNIPYFIGFNHFYFLKDNRTAVKYFEMAAKLKPSLVGIAAKLRMKLNETVIAIEFMEGLYKRTDNKTLKKTFSENIKFLKKLFVLEKAAKKYEKQFNKPIDTLNDLIETGLAESVPELSWLFWDKNENRIRLRRVPLKVK